MPPDEFPAGACPECGKTYCIGCAKEHVDENGRFMCPECQKNLKLSDDGLKKIIYDWAASAIPAASEQAGETPEPGKQEERGGGTPASS
jgi:transposase-like protein